MPTIQARFMHSVQDMNVLQRWMWHSLEQTSRFIEDRFEVIESIQKCADFFAIKG
jgi:hypothetical protein